MLTQALLPYVSGERSPEIYGYTESFLFIFVFAFLWDLVAQLLWDFEFQVFVKIGKSSSSIIGTL